LGIARHVHAIDISQGAIESARRTAEEAGLAAHIDYEVGDINKMEFSPSTYDLIVAMSSIHHVSELEKMFAQCARALKPGGLLFMDEYVGPSRFQTPFEIRVLIDGLLKTLPARYRRNLFTNDGATKDEYIPSTVEQMISIDPSEAVRSAEIMTVLRGHFDVLEYRPYGGGIQHQLFSGIMGNFDPENKEDVALLNAVSDLEISLENIGAAPSDFAAVVARPPRLP
jgi:SAM-dependent methyltransferase